MKISEKLPQFEKESLFVVAGRRSADIYSVFQGTLEKIESIRKDMPKYSDKEGFFMRLGKGKFFGAGSVLEEKKEKVDKEFNKELKEKIEHYFRRSRIEEIYLFVPGYAKKGLPEILPEDIKSKIVFIIEGNYAKSHPFELIEKIKKRQDGKKTKFISEAAMRILKKKR